MVIIIYRLHQCPLFLEDVKMEKVTLLLHCISRSRNGLLRSLTSFPFIEAIDRGFFFLSSFLIILSDFDLKHSRLLFSHVN